jgi:hypothetical protein
VKFGTPGDPAKGSNPLRRGAAVADRRLRYPLLWLLFLACMVAGAALLLSGDGTAQAFGIGLLLLPLILLGLLTGAYYALERWRAR